ncbi:MAG: hypothetical protein ACREKL_16945 [Chthoniobacterales bacterium]
MLKLYERLTALVEKLPGGVQKPILRELVPLRELFLEQRPARLLLIGGAAQTSAPALLHYLCGAPVETGAADRGWRRYSLAERGAIDVLDARFETPEDAVGEGIKAHRPDAVVFLRGNADAAADFDAAFECAVARIVLADGEGARAGMAGLAFGDEPEQSRARLAALLHSKKEFGQRELHVSAAEPETAESVAEAICGFLPNCAKLEFARLTSAKGAQAGIATALLKSFTAVCGVIGVQPIPLADMPILTTLQSLLVGSIIYVSGRRASARLIAEFTGALGVNIGVGFAFREGARALLKIFPIWGNAISGIVAGAGTYAIGRAAIAYFIEDRPLQETRKLFRKLQPGLESFKSRAMPRLRRRTGGD